MKGRCGLHIAEIMATETPKFGSLKFGGFHVAWAVAFWSVGAILILTDLIHSGAPARQLYVLALGGLLHALGVAEFGEYMSSLRRVNNFYLFLHQSWRRSVLWGALGGFCDVVITAGLFLLYPLLPDVSLGWAITIMMAVLLVPPYPVFVALALVRTQRRKDFERETHAA